MALTLPARKLGAERPPARLLSLAVWLPVAAQLAVAAAFQLLALASALRSQGYTPLDPPPDCFTLARANTPRCSRSADNSAVFLMSLAQAGGPWGGPHLVAVAACEGGEGRMWMGGVSCARQG